MPGTARCVPVLLAPALPPASVQTVTLNCIYLFGMSQEPREGSWLSLLAPLRVPHDVPSIWWQEYSGKGEDRECIYGEK